MPSRPGDVVVDSVFDDEVDSSFLATMEGQVDMRHDAGQAAPVTPPTTSVQLSPAPRQQHETRAHGTDETEDHDAKRARLESAEETKNCKDDGVQWIHDQNSKGWNWWVCNFGWLWKRVRPWCRHSRRWFLVWGKINYVLTMYQTLCGPTLPLDKQPQAPEAWIDALADAVEIDRLLKMESLTESWRVPRACVRNSHDKVCLWLEDQRQPWWRTRMDASKSFCNQGVRNTEKERHVFTCNWIPYHPT